jgi:hypothetical protein
MAAVTVDSGPVSVHDSLRTVPQAKWRDLMHARRLHLEIRLASDCRCLVEFVNDAELMYATLGFASAEAMVRDGYGLKPEEIGIAVEWLRLREPDEPIALSHAIEEGIKLRARKAQARDAADRANRRPAGRPKKGEAENVDNKNSVINSFRPSGTSAAYALRKLREQRPDIHARVLAGEITAHAGMIEAGFRKPQNRKRSPLNRVLKLIAQLDPDELRAVIEAARARLPALVAP